jgi:hypothetical protein
MSLNLPTTRGKHHGGKTSIALQGGNHPAIAAPPGR